MTYLPPSPDAWQTGGVLRLQPAPDGFFGEVRLGKTPVYVRRWLRAPDGTVTFEYQHASDEEFEAMAMRIAAAAGG